MAAASKHYTPSFALRGEGELPRIAPIRQTNVADHYKFKAVIGKGGCGTVQRAKLRGSKHKNRAFAVKIVPLHRLGDHCAELVLFPKLFHPNIVFLYEIFRSESDVHLVMELCEGNNLLHRIQHFWDGLDRDFGFNQKGLPAGIIGKYLIEMLSGVAYLHHHGIAHRDIKPENYMLQNKNDDAGLKLIDFGLAYDCSSGEPMTKRVGTLYYVAPEVFSCFYSEKCDLWSLGVCAFMASVAYKPLSGANDKETVALVKLGEVKFKNADWLPVPDALQDLIAALLTKAPMSRPSAGELLKDNAWLRRELRRRGSSCSCAFL